MRYQTFKQMEFLSGNLGNITESSKNYRKTVERSLFSKGRLFSTQISTYNLQMSNICAVADREMLNLEINFEFP